MSFPRLHIKIFGKRFHTFHFLGITGFVAGGLLGAVLCYLLQLPTWPILVMSLTAVATFFLLAILAKIITGREVIVYYHHEIGILIMCAIVFSLFHVPVLVYLDMTILGIATFMVFGRMGCLNVGCCHGKPARRGVVYRHEHVEAGFTHYYEGVPLFPVPLVESAFVFIVLVFGVVLVLWHSSPGTVLIFYTVAYGAFRFIIEFYRGDADRPYWKGVSEAQWTSLLLVTVTAVLSIAGVLPLYGWHLLMSVVLFFAVAVIILRKDIFIKVTSPRHVRQIAAAIVKPGETLIQQGQVTVDVFQTDLGLSVSKGRLMNEGAVITHYTVSYKDGHELFYPIVERIAEIIQVIQKHKGMYEIAERENSVYHILFRE
jgi:prolipoprotein diacylglyceryltransferase